MKKYTLKNYSEESHPITNPELPESDDSGIIDSGLIDSGLIDSGVLDSGIIDSGIVPEPDPDEPNNDDEEGLDSHHYTEEQMLEMVENGTWKGGYVNGLYYMPQLLVTPDNTDEGGNAGGGGSNTGGGNNTGGGSNTGGNNNSGNNSGGNSGSFDSLIKVNGGIVLNITKNASRISEITIQKLLNLNGYTGLIKVTSTARTPEEQGKAMLDNILLHGYDKQYSTYKIHGRNVIAKYNPSASYADNLSAMIHQIYIEGPHKVSHHCADFEEINVLDVSKNSLSDVAAFKNAVKEAGFSPVLDENGCIHIELKFQ